MTDNVHVAIRIRPMNDRERSEKHSNALQNSLDSILVTPSPLNPEFKMNFTFDSIFGEEATNTSIFNSLAKDIIDSTLNGVNGTIFAYGQTSSGKTYTMHGTRNDPGIIGLSIADIFKYVNDHPDLEFLLRVSYIEIYNENIRDLLDPSNDNLKIHENINREIFIGDLSEHVVASVEEIQQILQRGESNRHVGVTNMNDRSSRSHTIFKMVIESKERKKNTIFISSALSNDVNAIENNSLSPIHEQGNTSSRRNSGRQSVSGDAVRVSCLNLVDLAGSERAGHTGAEGVRLREGGHINKSLLALASVIQKLSEGGDKHIPYRDSKLTRILQPSLGGNAKTAIICTITPSSGFVDETLSTLKFASRAKTITNKPVINEVVSEETLLKRYEKEIQTLKSQLHEIKIKANGKSVNEETEANRDLLKRKLEEDEHEKNKLKNHIERLKKMILNSTGLDSTHSSAAHLQKKQRHLRRQTWFPSTIESEMTTKPSNKQSDIALAIEPLPCIPEIPSFEELHRFASKEVQVDDHSLFRECDSKATNTDKIYYEEITTKSLLLAYSKVVEEKKFLSIENLCLSESLRRPKGGVDRCIGTELDLDELIRSYKQKDSELEDRGYLIRCAVQEKQELLQLMEESLRKAEEDQTMIELFTSEKESLENKIQAMTKDFQSLNEHVNTQQVKFRTEKEILIEQNQGLQSQIDRLKSNLICKDEYNLLMAEKESLMRSEGNAQSEIKSLLDQKSNLQSEVYSFSNELDESKKLISSLQEENAALKEKTCHLQTLISTCKNKMYAVDHEKSSLMSWNLILQHQTLEKAQLLTQVQDQNSKLLKELDFTKQEAEAKISDLEQQLQKTSNEDILSESQIKAEELRLELTQKYEEEKMNLLAEMDRLRNEIEISKILFAETEEQLKTQIHDIQEQFELENKMNITLEETFGKFKLSMQQQLESFISFFADCGYEILSTEPPLPQIKNYFNSLRQSVLKYEKECESQVSALGACKEEAQFLRQQREEEKRTFNDTLRKMLHAIQEKSEMSLDYWFQNISSAVDDKLNLIELKTFGIVDAVESFAEKIQETKQKELRVLQNHETISQAKRETEGKFRQLQLQNEGLLKQLHMYSETEAELLNDNEQLKSEIMVLREEVTDLEFRNRQIDEKFESLCASSEEAVLEFNGRLDKLTREREDLVLLNVEFRKKEEQLVAALEDSENINKTLRTENQEFNIDIQNLEVALEKKEKHEKHLTSQIVSLSEFNNRLQLTLESYKTLKSLLVSKLFSRDFQETDYDMNDANFYTVVQRRLEKVHDDLVSTNDTLSAISREHENLKKLFESQNLHLAGKEEGTYHLKDQLASYKKSMDTMTQEGRLLYEKYQKLKIHNKTVEEQMVKLEEVKRSYEDKCRVLSSMSDQLMSKKGKLELQNSSMQEQLEQLQQRLANLEQENLLLVEEAQKLQTANKTLYTKTIQSDELCDRYELLEKEYKALLTELNRIQEENVSSMTELEKTHLKVQEVQESKKVAESNQRELLDKIRYLTEILSELLKRTFDVRMAIPDLEGLNLLEYTEKGFEMISLLIQSVKSLLIKIENASAGLDKRTNLSSLRMVMANDYVVHNSQSEQIERLQRELGRVQAEKENLRQQMDFALQNNKMTDKSQTGMSRPLQETNRSNLNVVEPIKVNTNLTQEKKPTQRPPTRSRLKQTEESNECKQQ